MQKPGIIILGSGLGGYMLAKEIRKHDTEVSLTLITRDAGRFYSKPQLSVALAQGKSIEDLTVGTVEAMAQQLRADIIPHTQITQIDRKQQLVVSDDGRQWSYSQLVLAVGAEHIKPRLQGTAAKDLICINDLQSYQAFRDQLQPSASIAIIGAGLVGCEFAHDFVRTGQQVTVIGLSQQPLETLLPPPCAGALQQALADEGVRWCLGDEVVSLDKCDGVYQIKTKQNQLIEAQYVLSAIGIKPRIDLASACGLSVQQGICVDNYLSTSDPHIFALGDCAQVDGQVRLYVAPLLQAARSLAKTLCGEKTAVTFPVMPIVIKTAACPIAVVPPAKGAQGSWQIEGASPNLCAKFSAKDNVLKDSVLKDNVSKDGALLGFALTGDQVRQRAALVKQMQQQASLS